MLKKRWLNEPITMGCEEIEKPPPQPLGSLGLFWKLVRDLFGKKPSGHATRRGDEGYEPRPPTNG
jgi:hypothetical protein